MKYRIMSAEMDDKGFVVIPENAKVIGGLYHPVTGKFVVACMIMVEEPFVPPTEEKEVKDEEGLGKETTVKEGQEEGSEGKEE